MTYAEFQEHFAEQAEAEVRRYALMSVAEIITEIQEGRLGECYQIWHVLGERAAPQEANELLLAFLSSPAEYLHRYHCAAALIQINKLTDWKPEQLSADQTHTVARNLEEVRRQLCDPDGVVESG